MDKGTRFTFFLTREADEASFISSTRTILIFTLYVNKYTKCIEYSIEYRNKIEFNGICFDTTQLFACQINVVERARECAASGIFIAY